MIDTVQNTGTLCRFILIALIAMAFFAVFTDVDVAQAGEIVSGFDLDYAVEFSTDIQNFQVFAVRPVIHLGNGRFSYRTNYGFEIILISNQTYVPLDLPLYFLGALVAKAVRSPDLLFAFSFPNSTLELNLDDHHRFKLLAGIGSDFMVVHGDAMRGIILRPHTGAQIRLGAFTLRLTGGYVHYWRFSRPDGPNSLSIGFGVSSGPEFFWSP